MADASRSLRLFAGVLGIIAGLLALTVATLRWRRDGTADWLQILLGVGFLGLGLYWWRRARVA